MASSPRHVAARVTPVVDTRVAHFAPAPSALSGRISVLARVDDGGGARLCPPRALAAAAPPRAFATSFRERPPGSLRRTRVVEDAAPARLPLRRRLHRPRALAPLAPRAVLRARPGRARGLGQGREPGHPSRRGPGALPGRRGDGARARARPPGRAGEPPGRHTRREPRRTRRRHARHGRVLRRRLPRSRRPRADRGPRRRAPRRRDSGRPRV